MFSLREFIKSGLILAVGKMADYQIILNAAGWHEKGVLEEIDLAEIQSVINEQYIVIEEETETETDAAAEEETETPTETEATE